MRSDLLRDNTHVGFLYSLITCIYCILLQCGLMLLYNMQKKTVCLIINAYYRANIIPIALELNML
jgi:hypothetical protein